ncbi:receptor like protein 9 [Hibiscus trionum]|uniref:Receptor like protein 9 n=1 Tax=Hibiscus trionum TaxID=183268 RepID=A0A9W7LYR6_HIBTR|nr:receptor like protein 9 [Hibiscus trionum]
MESTWLAMFLLGFLMLGGGGWSEGCLEEERVALSRLKPFFPFIDYYTTEVGGPRSDYYFEEEYYYTTEFGGPRSDYYFEGEYYGSVEEKESPLVDCCKWERVECNPTTGRLTHLFLNLSHIDYDSYDYEYNTKSWYLNASLFLPFEELQFLSLSMNLIAGCVADQGFERLSSRLNKLEILDLSHNYFNDSILASISELSSLKSLNLQDNQFTLLNPTNGINMLSKLNNLETLSLSEINLGNTILSQLHDLISLKSLNLQGCGLKGFVNLLEFDVLKNLKELYLDSNEIEGIVFIPSLNNLNGTIDVKDLNAFSNLEELFLWDNGVTELVPPQELRLMNLEVLDLFGNPLDTSILATLGRLSNLKTLSFRITQLNGSIDIKEMAGLSNLENLDMYCYSDRVCNISLQPLNLISSLKTLSLHRFNFKETRVHSHSQNKWQNLTNLEELELWDSSLPSNFIGTLPSLKRLFIYYCYLDDSLLQDPFKLKNLEILNIFNTSLGNNFLQKLGAMPSLKILSLRKCELDGTEVQGLCGLTNLRTLDLSYNQLKGNLSECISNFTSLERLDLSSNHFSGDVSVFESLTSLKVLTLSNNYFQIPSSLGPFFNLSELKVFSADNNTIYVESEMQSLVPTFQLKKISLSCCGDGGQIPQFLYHQHDLRVVDLSNINLKGDFPNWLLQNNTNLLSLNLANNSLLGPVELSFLPHTELLTLDISKNFFNGKVPLEIGAKLPSLWFLNMSKNHFHGSIPASIGDMNSLQELDLSDNQLSGGLPKHLFMGCSLLFSLTLSNC